LWSAETAGTDAFTPLALVAEWAPELRLGTAIAPVYTRGPGLLAMSAGDHRGAPRPAGFVLGIGSSSPVIVHDWNAAEFTDPYDRNPRHAAVPACRRCPARRSPRTTRRSPSASSSWNARLRSHRGSCLARAAARACCGWRPAEADGAITNWLAAADVPQVRAELGPDVEAGRPDLRLPPPRTSTPHGGWAGC